jgi:polyisoprenoid-binding protein YceI
MEGKMRSKCIVPLFCLALALTVPTPKVTGRVASDVQNSPPKYVLDPGRSTFAIRAFSGGLLWFKGHDHIVAARDFEGEAIVRPDAPDQSSLRMTIRAASLVETRDVFTEEQKKIINKELREIVLEPDKYPEVTFQSTQVSGKLEGGILKARIVGNLTLHGVTRQVEIPADVTIAPNEIRARGDFNIERSDFKVKATSAVHGMVRVRDKLKVMFDMVGRRT